MIIINEGQDFLAFIYLALNHNLPTTDNKSVLTVVDDPKLSRRNALQFLVGD